MAKPLERNQIQGIVKSAYGHLPVAAYVLLTVGAGRATDAGRWFASLAAQITTCETKNAYESLNVAFTCAGLRNLGAPDTVVGTFSAAFIDGMTSPRRASILGDAAAETGLRWGGPGTSVDVLLMLYARDEPLLERRLSDMVAHATANGIASRILRADSYSERREHFGFVDGISQPTLEDLHSNQTPSRHEHLTQREASHQSDAVYQGDVVYQRHAVRHRDAVYQDAAHQSDGRDQHDDLDPRHVVLRRDVVKDGEFVLGYTNEYGYPSEAPRLGPKHDLGRNGSYLVFRQLTQDVAGFRQFLDAQANGDADARDLLAAKIVGRWQNGAPLVKTTRADDPAFAASPDRLARARANGFGFAEDPDGVRCPLGAHIRRANPRDAAVFGNPGEAQRRTARHRLLRRGRSYGPRFDDPAAPPQSERGLYFIALCADIERQFEFVQQSWLNNPAFNDLDEVDPLVGHQSADSTFTIQGPIVRRRIKGMQSFVQFVGGAYFFVPSIAALEWLAASAASRWSAPQSSPVKTQEPAYSHADRQISSRA